MTAILATTNTFFISQQERSTITASALVLSTLATVITKFLWASRAVSYTWWGLSIKDQPTWLRARITCDKQNVIWVSISELLRTWLVRGGLNTLITVSKDLFTRGTLNLLKTRSINIVSLRLALASPIHLVIFEPLSNITLTISIRVSDKSNIRAFVTFSGAWTLLATIQISVTSIASVILRI